MAANARTAPRKRTTAKPAVVEAPDFAPVHLSSSKPVEPEERVVLFYVDDKPYTIPRKIGRNHGLRFLRTARKQGEPLAAQELLENLIGEEGYEALMDCDNLDDEQLDAIMNRLRDEALGAIEEPEGNGRGR